MIRSLKVGLLAALVFVVCSASAHAYQGQSWSQLSADEKQAAVDTVKHLGGRPAPAGSTARYVGDGLLREGANPSPNTPPPSELAKVEDNLLRKTGALEKVRVIAPRFFRVAGTAGLVATTLISLNDAGKWMYTKWAAPDDAGTGGSGWTWTGLTWFNQDYDIYYGAKVPSPGRYLYRGYQTWPQDEFNPVRWFENPCKFSGFAGPPGARMEYGVATTARCAYPISVWPYQAEASILVDYPYLTEDDIRLAQPVRPWNGSESANTSAYPPATLPPDFEDRVGQAWDTQSPAMDWTRDFFEWADYDRDPATDPRTTPAGTTLDATQWQRWCELSTPGAGYVASNEDKWAQKEYFPASSLGFGVPLLWGEDTSGSAPGGDYSGVKGFGFRKIALKHGWTESDRVATQEALMYPSTTQGRYRMFQGPEYNPVSVYAKPGAKCARRVVVELVGKDNAPARQIITSYGNLVNRSAFAEALP